MKSIKNIKSKLAIALSALSLTGACSITQTGCFRENEVLKSISQVREDAELFDADLLILDKHSQSYENVSDIVRLKHNNDKPIYVYIEENVNDKTKGLIEKSLNYVEDIFSFINDNYTFEIVEKSQVKNISNLTTIRYSMLDTGQFINGLNYSAAKMFQTPNFWEYFNISSQIYLSPTLIENDDDSKILYTITHELLHSFGLADMYNGDKDLTSFMNIENGRFSGIISPNDFRSLYAAYGDKHIVDNKIDETKVNEVQKLLDDYENYYHKHIFNKINKINSENDANFNIKNIEKNEFLNKKFITEKKSGNVPAPWFNIDKKGADTEIIINGNSTTVNLYYYGELNQSCTGTVLYYDNFIVLTGLKAYTKDKTGNYNEKYDLYLYKTNENEYKVTRIFKKNSETNFVNYMVFEQEKVECISLTF